MTQAPDPPEGGALPRPWKLRRALGPLLAYHALVLVGGFLIIEGVLGRSSAERDVGVAILVAGVATAIAVVLWAAKLAGGPGSSGPGGRSPSRICPRCGRPGRDGRTVCDRCGAPLVWSVRST